MRKKRQRFPHVAVDGAPQGDCLCRREEREITRKKREKERNTENSLLTGPNDAARRDESCENEADVHGRPLKLPTSVAANDPTAPSAKSVCMYACVS